MVAMCKELQTHLKHSTSQDKSCQIYPVWAYMASETSNDTMKSYMVSETNNTTRKSYAANESLIKRKSQVKALMTHSSYMWQNVKCC